MDVKELYKQLVWEFGLEDHWRNIWNFGLGIPPSSQLDSSQIVKYYIAICQPYMSEMNLVCEGLNTFEKTICPVDGLPTFKWTY